MTDQAAPSKGRGGGDSGAGIGYNGVKSLRGASFLRFDDRLLFAFLFFSSLLAAARGVHEGYEKVMCHPDYSNATTVFDYSFKNLDGDETPFTKYQGNVILVVNTATY